MAYIQVPPQSTGEKVDIQQLADGAGNNVDRQVVSIGDGTTYGRRAVVTAGGAVTVDGSAVMQPVSIGATVRVDPTGTTAQPVTLHDAAGNNITSTGSAL